MIENIALSVMVVLFIIIIFFILLSMISGPFFILYNITIGLFLGKLTFGQCMITTFGCFCIYTLLAGILKR
jgi:hypothetical protein